MSCQNLNDFLEKYRGDIELNGYFNNENFVTLFLLFTGLRAKLVSHSVGSGAFPTYWLYEIGDEVRVLKEWFNGDYGYAFVM